MKRDQERPLGGEVGEEVRKPTNVHSGGKAAQEGTATAKPKVLYKPPTCLVHRRKSTEAGVAWKGRSEVVEGLEITGTRSCGTVLVLTRTLVFMLSELRSH